METPTPNPDDNHSNNPSPVKPEEKEKVKEEIIQKIENEAIKNPIIASQNPKMDPNIKKKLEGEFDAVEKDTQSKKDKDTQSKKDKKPIKIEQETPTPGGGNEEDKIPLMKPQENVKPQPPAPVKENLENKEKEKLDIKESAPSGNNLGISLRIPEKDKNEKKGGKEESKI